VAFRLRLETLPESHAPGVRFAGTRPFTPPIPSGKTYQTNNVRRRIMNAQERQQIREEANQLADREVYRDLEWVTILLCGGLSVVFARLATVVDMTREKVGCLIGFAFFASLAIRSIWRLIKDKKK
jgi:hypothetical protein